MSKTATKWCVDPIGDALRQCLPRSIVIEFPCTSAQVVFASFATRTVPFSVTNWPKAASGVHNERCGDSEGVTRGVPCLIRKASPWRPDRGATRKQSSEWWRPTARPTKWLKWPKDVRWTPLQRRRRGPRWASVVVYQPRRRPRRKSNSVVRSVEPSSRPHPYSMNGPSARQDSLFSPIQYPASWWFSRATRGKLVSVDVGWSQRDDVNVLRMTRFLFSILEIFMFRLCHFINHHRVRWSQKMPRNKNLLVFWSRGLIGNAVKSEHERPDSICTNAIPLHCKPGNTRK